MVLLLLLNRFLTLEGRDSCCGTKLGTALGRAHAGGEKAERSPG
jgi:hypothetical protein